MDGQPWQQRGEWRQVPLPTTGPSHKLLTWDTGRMLSFRWDSGGFFHFPPRKDSKTSQDQVQPPSHPCTLLNHSFIHSAPTVCQAPTAFSDVSMRWIWQSPVLRSWWVLSWCCQGVQLKGQWSCCPCWPQSNKTEPKLLTTAGAHQGNTGRTLHLAFSLVSSQRPDLRKKVFLETPSWGVLQDSLSSLSHHHNHGSPVLTFMMRRPWCLGVQWPTLLQGFPEALAKILSSLRARVPTGDSWGWPTWRLRGQSSSALRDTLRNVLHDAQKAGFGDKINKHLPTSSGQMGQWDYSSSNLVASNLLCAQACVPKWRSKAPGTGMS